MIVAKENDVVEGKPFCSVFNGKKIALFKIEKAYYALENTCTHMGGPLCKGTLNEEVVTCPLHGSKFNVKTGSVIGGPAIKPVKRYEVRVVGQDIEITQ